MIIRARPRYIKTLELDNIPNYAIDDSELYFNSGRAALKFLLSYLAEKIGKNISIGLQDFNCEVVVQAALEAGCKVYLFDINLTDLSLSYKELKKHIKKIDVLLLTHYQGIPCFEYIEIVELCKKYNVIVIDDLAQTYGSKINNIKVGTLSSYSIYSYAFDKPFSVFSGGKLKVNNKQELESIKIKYKNLPVEKLSDAMNDLNLLLFLYKYTDKGFYLSPIMNNYLLLKFLIRLKLNYSTIYKILTLLNKKTINKLINIINKIIYKFIINNQITILQMNNKKINFIKDQEKNFKYNYDNVMRVKEICKQFDVVTFDNYNKAEIYWNRYSVLDKNGDLKEYLIKNNIEVGNYNWPITLSKIYFKNKKVIPLGSLDNSQFASKHILNIPLWCSYNDK